jgi:cytochrome P450
MSLATAPCAPGPGRRYPLANWLALRRNPLEFLEGLARDYGDVARFRLGPVFVYLVNDPELIRSVLVTRADAYHKGRALERAKRLLGEGLLTSEESVHLRQRRLMQPAFHRERISGYGETMVRYAERATERWKAGETIDVHREMVGLTLAIVGKTLFDADVEGEADEIGGALTEVMELFQRLLMVPFGELLEKLPLPSTRRFERARGRLDATIARLIAERRKNPRDRTDLLTLLILAQDTEGDGGGMSDAQLRDEAMTIFLAGHAEGKVRELRPATRGFSNRASERPARKASAASGGSTSSAARPRRRRAPRPRAPQRGATPPATSALRR